MAEARKLTFEQTFAKCAIPQGVLSALGPCPAEVRVNKAARSMLVTVHADCTPDVGALRQAEAALVRCFRLQSARVEVVADPAPATPAPQISPEAEKKADPVPTKQTPAGAVAQSGERKGQDLFGKMAALRKSVMSTPGLRARREKKRGELSRSSVRSAPESSPPPSGNWNWIWETS